MIEYQRIVPIEGMNTESDQLLVQESFAAFIKNIRIEAEEHGNYEEDDLNITQGQNAGLFKPVLANVRACPGLKLPEGNNATIGSRYFKETDEVYVAVHNDAGNHLIYRINCDNTCDIVYNIGACLDFDLNRPIIASNWHMWIYPDSAGPFLKGKKYLVFTDGSDNGIRWIDVEASILTNSFTLPYFEPQAPLFDACEYIELAARPPWQCPQIVDATTQESRLAGGPDFDCGAIYFTYRFIYIDGRSSVWSPMSLPYIYDFGQCADPSDLCLKLILDTGSAMVDKIEIAYSQCRATTEVESEISSKFVWYQYGIYDKYKCQDNPGKIQSLCGDNVVDVNPYWTRELSDNIIDNKLRLVICNIRNCLKLDDVDVNRSNDEIPIASMAVSKVDDRIVAHHNKYGYNNLPCGADGLTINVESEELEVCSFDNIETRTIEVLCVIHNNAQGVEQNQIIYQINEGGPHYWGGIKGSSVWEEKVGDSYKQTPNVDASMRGFLVGTGCTADSKQVFVDVDGNISDAPDFVLDGDNFDAIEYFDNITNGGFYGQLFRFTNVPAGIHLFRLTSHNAKEGDKYEELSTTACGTIEYSDYVIIGNNHYEDLKSPYKELYLDVCDEDHLIGNKLAQDTEMIIIEDLTAPTSDVNLNVESRAISFYIREQRSTELPIELANVFRRAWNSSRIFSQCVQTDHNGFGYVAAGRGGIGFSPWAGAEIRVESPVNDCQETIAFDDTDVRNSSKSLVEKIVYLEESPPMLLNGTVEDYLAKCHYIIQKQITDCEGNPIANVPYITQYRRAQFSDANGNLYYKVHSESRGGEIITGQSYKNITSSVNETGCLVVNCGSCDTCFSIDEWIADVCLASNGAVLKSFPTTQLDLVSNLISTIKSGSLRKIGFKLHDKIDRKTFVQTANNLQINIPENDCSVTSHQICYEWDELIDFPSEFSYLSFYIGQNQRFDQFFQWKVDTMEFTNDSGESVQTGITKVKICLFNQPVDNLLCPEDRIGFDPTRGDTIILKKLNGQCLNYRMEIDCFENGCVVVDYDEELKNIGLLDIVIDDDDTISANNLIVEIRSKPKCDTKLFHQICNKIVLVDREINGKTYRQPEQMSGCLVFYDSYWRNTSFGTGCNGAPGSLVESPSVNDFCGLNCDSSGRPNAENEYAAQRWYPTSSWFSDPYLVNSDINGLATWYQENKKSFGENDYDAIVAVDVHRRNMLYITESDYFTVQVGSIQLRTSDGGALRADSSSFLSDPNSRIGSRHGCRNEDKRTIKFKDGLAEWLDIRRGVYVQTNWRDEKQLSEFYMGSYFLEKIKWVEKYNKENKRQIYWHSGIDPKTKESIVTSKRPYSESINDFGYKKINENETIAFAMGLDRWPRFYSFTPEWYQSFESSVTGKELISFVNGEPWIHHNHDRKEFNVFYGQAVQKYIAVICNKFPENDKIFHSVALEISGHSFYVEKAVTDEGQESNLPLDGFIKQGQGYYAALRRATNTGLPDVDINSVPLFDGDHLKGRWMKVRFAGDPENKSSYFEMLGIVFGFRRAKKTL